MSAEWDAFRAAIAEITLVPLAEIGRDSTLKGDLDLDSLGLAELGVYLEERYGATNLIDQLEQVEWQSLRAGDVFDNFAGGRSRLPSS